MCCKRKQYDSVRCLSVFLFPLAEKYVAQYEQVHNTGHSDSAPSLPSLSLRNAASCGAKEEDLMLLRGPPEEEHSEKEESAVKRILWAREAEEVHHELRHFLEASRGSPRSLSHEGPIAVDQLHSLQRLSEGSIRQLFQFFVATLFPLRSRRSCVGTATRYAHIADEGETVLTGSTTEDHGICSPDIAIDTGRETSSPYPQPTPLCQTLWSRSETRARYIEKLCDARARKVQCSVDLTKPGYLQEAGLHALEVFCPNAQKLLSGRSGAQELEGEEKKLLFAAHPHLDVSTAALSSSSSSSSCRSATQVEHLWSVLIDRYTLSLPDRSNIHELENLPQEMAIGELVWTSVEAILQAKEKGSSGVGRDGQAKPANEEEEQRGRVDDGVALVSGTAMDSFRPLCETRTEVARSWLDCVVDVGGGNGFLAASLAERLGCDATVIDPYYPNHSIDCCPRLWPDTPTDQRQRPARRRERVLNRLMARFREIAPLWCRHPHHRFPPPQESFSEAEETRKAQDSPHHSALTFWSSEDAVAGKPAVASLPQRYALVAKHLCGTAVDQCLRHLEEQCCSSCLPAVLVLAPCCFHRCAYKDYIHQDFLKEVLQVTDSSVFDMLCCLTAWNKSVYQAVQSTDSQPSISFEDGVRNDHQELQSKGVGEADVVKRPISKKASGEQVRKGSSAISLPSGEDHPAEVSSIQFPLDRTSSDNRVSRVKKKKKAVVSLIPCAEAIMEGVEHLLNFGRELWLHERGYHTAYVEYVPRYVTPKNKCIVAYRIFPPAINGKDY